LRERNAQRKALQACLEKLGIGPHYEVPDRLIRNGFTSVDILKGLDDNEISNFFDSALKTAGFLLTDILVRRVKLLAYYLRHLDRVQRAFDLDNVTLEKLEEMKLMKDFEEEQKKKIIPTFPFSSTISKYSLPTSRGGLARYLEQFLGSSGVPLTYVIREQEQPSAEEEYGDAYDEMVARAPLKGFYFERDNKTVWHFLWNILGPCAADEQRGLYNSCMVTPWEKYCREFQSTKDGRAAYMKLKQNGWV
jgi:hypothetical protein